MGYRLHITASAEKDLDEILTYIIGELDNLDAAIKLADEIDERYGKLEENPFIYEECRDPRLKLLGYRRIVIGGYLLVYRIDEDEKTVYVERFFSQLQDYRNRF